MIGVHVFRRKMCRPRSYFPHVSPSFFTTATLMMDTHTTLDLKELWGRVLTPLQSLLKKSEFLTWFGESVLLSYQGEVLTIGVPSDFYLQNMTKYLPIVQEAAQSTLANEYPVQEVRLCVDATIHKGDKRLVSLQKLTKSIDRLEKRELSGEVTLVEGLTSKLLNPKYSLENFIVGPSSQLAFAACQAVAQRPGTAYNPLFIYGDVGLGKTHLLQAVGNAIHKKDKKKAVVYSTSEKFLNEVVEAVQKRQTDKLRSKYRQIDVLIIDDIQFLANKDQTQIEFFHTFNVLYEARKQIILSSDRPPKELVLLEPRLRSRFESGMIVDVQFPDFETRLAILREKCQERGVMMSHDVLEFIAHNCLHSVRELEGILNQALAQYELVHKIPTIRSIGPILQKLNKNTPLTGYVAQEHTTHAQTEAEVIAHIARYYKVSSEDICGDSRKKEIALPRQIAMYFCKVELGKTYERIGEMFGGRLHTTVMHAVQKIQTLIKKEGSLARDIALLSEELGFTSH